MELISSKRSITLKTEPKLLDKVIQDIQQALYTDLSWLTHSFGRCERLVKTINGRRIYTPNLYVGKNEYIPLVPDERLGNYSFFVMDEPEELDWSAGLMTRYNCPFSLVIWVDMRTVAPDDERNDERVKEQIINVLHGGAWIRSGGVRAETIYSRPENVFREFDIDEVDNQYLMAPYCGWRISGEMWIRGECLAQANYLVVKPDVVQWITDKLDYDIYSNTDWIIV